MAREEGRSLIEAWFAALKPWPRRALTMLAGAVATLGHAPFQVAPAYVAAIVVLVWLLDAAARRPNRLKSAFLTGLLFGWGHLLTGMYWVASAFLVDADTWGLTPGIAAALGLSGGLALFWGAGCALAMTFWTTDVRRLAAFAAALSVTEWLRGNILTGLPWLLPGYVWTPGEPISQLASVFGIYGLSALTLLVASAPAAMSDWAPPARRFAPLLAAALAVGLAWGWGEQRIAGAPHDLPGEQPIVRVADSGLSQAEKWANNPDQEERVLRLYLEASGPPDSHNTIVIWPEGAIPVVNFFTLEQPAFLGEIGAGLGDRALVTGLSRREIRNGRMAYFNSAAVIDGVSGVPRISQVYDKHHLVPFGEYLPWPLASLAEQFHIASLQQIGSGFEAGPPPTRLVVPDAPPAVVLICYESIYPGLVPSGDERPGWIINISNDAWFGEAYGVISVAGAQIPAPSSGPWQAYEMARYRAIESGLPLARAASGGVSAIVDSFGRAVRASHRRGGFAEAQLPPSLPETIFAKWGAWLTPLLIALLAALRFFPRALARGRKS